MARSPGPCRRWPTPTRCGCSVRERRRRARTGGWGPATSRWCWRCAGGLMGCRWRSSWPRHAPAPCRPARSPPGWTGGSSCWPTARAPSRPATRRCERRWTGATTCSASASNRCCATWGVFAGGFDLDAVAAVCPAATLELLAALVDRSLVAEGVSGGDRYRLLETVRSYALEQLTATGEAGCARSRHRDHYLGLAELAEPMISGPDQQEWMDRLAPDHDNVAAALTFSRDQADAELVARLAVAMTPFWLERSQWTECRVWLDAAMAADGVQPGLRAQVLTCLCYLETWLGRLAVVPALAGEALALARTASARREEGRALGYLAV